MITRELCEKVLTAAASTGADYAELYAERTLNCSIHMVADAVDTIKDTLIAGVGIRVCKGLRSITATTVEYATKAEINSFFNHWRDFNANY